jgi:hypothetical protein
MPGTATYKYRPEAGASRAETGVCLNRGVHAVINMINSPPSSTIKMLVFVFMFFIYF